MECRLGWGHDCGLNILAPLKFTCGNPNPQCATLVQLWGPSAGTSPSLQVLNAFHTHNPMQHPS